MFDDTQLIKAELKTKGWSYRRAGKAIGKSYQWISTVLNDHQRSQPVLSALYALPDLNANSAGKDTQAGR